MTSLFFGINTHNCIKFIDYYINIYFYKDIYFSNNWKFLLAVYCERKVKLRTTKWLEKPLKLTEFIIIIIYDKSFGVYLDLINANKPRKMINIS